VWQCDPTLSSGNAGPRRTTEKPVRRRLLEDTELCDYLGLELSRFRILRPALEARGFPVPLPDFGRYDRKAVDTWLDAESGLTPTTTAVPSFPTRAFRHPFNRAPSPEPPNAPPKKGPTLDAAGYTVADAVADYVENFQDSPTTLRDTLYHINAAILPAFGMNRVVDLQVEEIRAWHRKIAERPRKVRGRKGEGPRYHQGPFDAEARRRRKSSANRVLVVLKAALNHAYRDGKVPTDDAWRRVQAFRRVSIGPGAYLTREQCRALVQSCAPDFRRFVQAALLTGARFGEIRDITAKDFDAEAGTVFFAHSKSRRPRYVVLTDEGRRFISEITLGLSPKAPLFLRGDGEPWHPTDPYPRLDAACRLAGIEPRATFHHLRHTYASLLAMKGTPMAVIAKNLGHSTSEPCEKYYAHLAPSYVSETIRERMPELGIIDGTPRRE
jgi:integrase